MHHTFWVATIFCMCVHSTTPHSYFDEEKWKHAGDFVKEYINPDKEPCNEFYEHVCGNYDDKNGTRFDTRIDHSGMMFATILKAILQIDLKNNATSPQEKSVRLFYDQCILSAKAGLNTWKGLEDATFARLHGYLRHHSKKINPWRFLAFVKKETGADIKFMLVTDPIKLRKGADYALFPIPPDQESNKQSQQMTTEETIVERVALRNLSAVLPSFDWVSYFDELLPRDLKDKHESIIDIYYPATLEAIAREVNRMKMTENDTRQILDTILNHMNEKFLDLIKSNTRVSRVSVCIVSTMRHLSPAVTNLYFKTIGQDILEWRQDIVTLARNLFSAFSFLISNVDWMNVHEKEKLQDKADDMRFFPGIPDWIKDEKKLEEETARYIYTPKLSVFENEFRFIKADFERELRQVRSKIIKDPKPEFDVNAYYSPQNAITLHLGVLLPPFYHINYPLAVKYGGLGNVLGHELMHAFDSSGIFESPHPDDEWLDSSFELEIEKRQDCLIRQYSTYCYRDKGQCVDGSLTLAENMADIDGLKVAFAAYKFTTQIFKVEPPIPAMLKYTQDQMFFLTCARIYCSKGWYDGLLHDEHTPNKPRIDIMMRNVNLFARSFKCEVGTNYAPFQTCSVWGDFDNPAKKR